MKEYEVKVQYDRAFSIKVNAETELEALTLAKEEALNKDISESDSFGCCAFLPVPKIEVCEELLEGWEESLIKNLKALDIEY